MAETSTIYEMPVRWERDVVVARQRAREIAVHLGFDVQEQTRIATSCSEIARNAFQYAGGGRVEFLLTQEMPQQFVIVVSDNGKGIPDSRAILAGHYRSSSGMGVGIVGAKRLMDDFVLESSRERGTRVTMSKGLPRRLERIRPEQVRNIAALVGHNETDDIVSELQSQNRELMSALQHAHERQIELDRLNRELDDTNRGVVALYAELDERAGLLQRTSELKSSFLSNMSHEFRTPLNSVISLSQLLMDRVDGDLTPEQEKQVIYIRRSAESLLELVNDLLDLAKIEAGKVSIRAEEFHIEALFGALRGMLKPLTNNPNVKLIFEDSAQLPPLVTDESKVSQILRNFISNALKFTQSGEVRVSARRGQHDTIVFEVEDTGIGIAEQDMQRIFEEFTQVENPLQRKSKGTGLGLPLTRKLAELLGGGVYLRSELGKGSTFTAVISRIYHEYDMSQDARTSPKELTGSAHVLIVDDDQVARYLMRGLLGSQFHVYEASGGEEALRLMETRVPDVAIVDLMMPGMTGAQLLEEMKDTPSLADIPVVIHTSKVLQQSERERLLARAVAIIPKESRSREESLANVRAALRLAGVAVPVTEDAE